MDLSKIKTSKKLEVEGVWVPLDDNSRLLVARTNNERFKKLMSEKAKPYKQAIRSDTLPDDVYERILIDAMGEAILLGWENLTEGDTPLSYSVENAKRLLRDYPDFRDMVSGFSQEASLFREKELELDAKN